MSSNNLLREFLDFVYRLLFVMRTAGDFALVLTVVSTIRYELWIFFVLVDLDHNTCQVFMLRMPDAASFLCGSACTVMVFTLLCVKVGGVYGADVNACIDSVKFYR